MKNKLQGMCFTDADEAMAAHAKAVEATAKLRRGSRAARRVARAAASPRAPLTLSSHNGAVACGVPPSHVRARRRRAAGRRGRSRCPLIIVDSQIR
ncbi:hypothetical protein EVAR_63896_1 [Eumeta japonica]|uniref:Uncharacterized protein n=1 Tax=Eumeta variegata TaxID=151549 RepID=A0A4C1ZP73_EUMVA|nr:hypothetical protein EVAR_63896_1 [Eumeta japonica]